MYLKSGGLLIAASAGAAQQFSSGSSSATSATATGSSSNEPCAQVSASLSSYSAANPSATNALRLPYDIAQACAMSVEIVPDDATALIEGLQAMLEFQSDLAFKADPPSGYLLAPIDMMQELQNLTDAVNSGQITREMDFQRSLVTIFGQAHDGHLTFTPDGLSIIRTARNFGALVSLSLDGIEAPKLYFYQEVLDSLSAGGVEVSAVTRINGQDANEFIMYHQMNTTFGGFQDPDALYNHYLVALNTGAPGPINWGGLFEGYSLTDTGPTTSIEFENGTMVERDNYAYTRFDFTGVVDGVSFYNTFLNWTVKEEAISSSRAAQSTATATATAIATPSATSATATQTQIYSYPSPIVISEDGTASGYFLNETGFEDVAVLALRQMSLEAQVSFQATVTEFLDQCRSQNKQRLILDLSGNSGGTILLGYDVFKQLFPSLVPYGAGNLRASESFRLIGEAVTPIAEDQLLDDPSNYTTLSASNFAAFNYYNASNQPFTSFAEYFGPITTGPGPDNYTNLQRLNISTPEINEATGGIVVSGYANNTEIAPQPFTNENIIILSDGRCSSTCTTLTHFLKYQAKVKSIALGGRPFLTNTTNDTATFAPMQTIGGIKGSQVTPLSILYTIIINLYEVLPESTTSAWVNTTIETIYNLSGYVSLRSNSAGSNTEEISINFKNNIAETDPVSDPVPLQFVYEAADCRMFYRPAHFASAEYLWLDVAANAFGLNGTEVFTRCVPGSTGHPSSLSGDAALYDGGRMSDGTNTTSDYESGSNSDSGSNGGSSENSAARPSIWSSTSMLVVALFSMFFFAF